MSVELRSEFTGQGFVERAIELADASAVAPVHAELALFDRRLEAIRAEGRSGVPYCVTPAVERMARDAAIVSTVEAILGTPEWVMWGANLRRDTPNQASRWHVDLESLLWPSITVGVGIAECSEAGATWFLPGSQRLAKSPPGEDVPARAARLVDVARRAHPEIGEPRRVQGFGVGRFGVFDARCWHRSDPHHTEGRVVLFLHYHAARDPRIPLMLDHEREHWANEACPFIAYEPEAIVEARLARVPWRHRVGVAVHRWRRAR